VRSSGSEGESEVESEVEQLKRARKASVCCFSAGRKPPSRKEGAIWYYQHVRSGTPNHKVTFEKKKSSRRYDLSRLRSFSFPPSANIAHDHAFPSNLGSVYR
jgi:hypothetical protein